jgi:hypothetical protein
MWPSVPKIIPERQLGTAYAVIFYIQNIGLVVIPMLLGFVLTTSNPDVSPNKLLIKSSIEQSYHQVLATSPVAFKEKEVSDAIDKTTENIVDSIVQHTYYTPALQKTIHAEALQQQMVASNVQAVKEKVVLNGSKASLLAMGDVFAQQTYPIIKENKLNITYNYENDILIFVLLGILSVLFGVLLKAEDKKKGYGLEKPNMVK